MFHFITNILDKNTADTETTNLRSFYNNNYAKINNSNNEGAGSIALNNKSHNIQSFIKKTAIPPKYGKILQELSLTYKNTTILELGTSLGISANNLAANKTNQVHTIEGNTEMHSLTEKAFKELNISNVTLHQGTFEHLLEKIAKEIAPISIVFIDGNHQKEATINYFTSLLPFISENSVIILDDIYWSKEMTEAWQEIRLHKKVRLSIDLYRMGLLFFREEQKEKEDFTLWY